MRWKRGWTLLVPLILAVAVGEAASAQSGSRQTAKARFVEQHTGVPTGLTFEVDYVNPDDPTGKPPAVRTVVESLAPDARFDTRVPALCTASDAELMSLGAEACPPDTRVGSGYIKIDTGFPEPNRFLEVDVTFLNNTNQLIFLTQDRDTGARVVARATIEGGRLTSSAPPLPGTPPDGGALDYVQTHLDEISRPIDGEVRGYITTPSKCPASRQWSNFLSFTYADEVTQNVTSESPCTPVGGLGSGPVCETESRGDRGRNKIAGGAKGDRIFGRGGDDRLAGRGGRDCLYGQRGDDLLLGGPGRDRLRGGPGRDRLRGGPGRDRLRGGPGRDRLRGGPGEDVCIGGRGRDRFRGCELRR